MSDPINHGGSAFPIQTCDLPGSYSPEPGMSLRDYMATKFMAALICSPVASEGAESADLAAFSISLADALIAALSK